MKQVCDLGSAYYAFNNLATHDYISIDNSSILGILLQATDKNMLNKNAFQ